ncbi:MAG: glycosyltransferase [Candidatus Aenigmatarchaeota archaeon]
MKPLISVIVPTYNEEKYLEATLRSIKNQDYGGKVEIIVSDGRSRDNTLKIARKYANKIVITKKKCPAVGRNAGASVAKGDILVFVDADTLILYNTLSELAKVFKKKEVVGVACLILPISNKIIDYLIYWFINNFIKFSIFLKTPCIPGIFCAYRKDAFKSVGGFNENLYFDEDLDLSKRISKVGKIVFKEKILVFNSVRRFEKWGRIKTAYKYIFFTLTYFLTGRTYKNFYTPVR